MERNRNSHESQETFSISPAVVALMQPATWTPGTLTGNRRLALDSLGPFDDYLSTLQYFVNEAEERLLI
jgi:hypothetical protein